MTRRPKMEAPPGRGAQFGEAARQGTQGEQSRFYAEKPSAEAIARALREMGSRRAAAAYAAGLALIRHATNAVPRCPQILRDDNGRWVAHRPAKPSRAHPLTQAARLLAGQAAQRLLGEARHPTEARRDRQAAAALVEKAARETGQDPCILLVAVEQYVFATLKANRDPLRELQARLVRHRRLNRPAAYTVFARCQRVRCPWWKRGRP